MNSLLCCSQTTEKDTSEKAVLFSGWELWKLIESHAIIIKKVLSDLIMRVASVVDPAH